MYNGKRGMFMGLMVTTGAICQCTFGTTPCALQVTTVQTVMSNNKPVASIMDHTPANLATFGMCSSMANPAVAAATAAALGVLTPQPCTPVIPAPWVPGSPTVLCGQYPALTHTAKAMCAYAGVISIQNPGQQKAQVP